MGRVLNHSESVPLRERGQGLVVAGMSGKVDGNHSASPRRYFAFDVSRIEREGRGADVGKDGAAATIEHAIGAGDERDGGDDDFVTGANARRDRRRMKGGRARIEGDGEPRLGPAAQPALKFSDRRP